MPKPTENSTALIKLARWCESHPIVTCCTAFLLIFAIIGVQLYRQDAYVGTPRIGDAPSYDNLGLSWMHGRGQTYDFHDPEWREPYEEANDDGRYDETLFSSIKWYPTAIPTSMRPPGYPILVACTYAVSDRNFAVTRLVNTALMSGAILCIVCLMWKAAGPGPAFLCGLVASFDPHLVSYSGQIMSEALAAFLIAWTCWLTVAIIEHPTRRGAVFLGIVLGLVTLVRTFFIMWYPLLGILLWLMLRRHQKQVDARQRMVIIAIMIAAAFVVVLPWMVRNVVVHRAFLPLGVQGAIAISGGYNDAFWERGNGHEKPVFPEIDQTLRQDEEYRNAPRHLKNRDLARASSRQAVQWILKNPQKMPFVIKRKIASHLEHSTRKQPWFLPVAVFGFLLLWHRPTGLALGGFFVVNLACVAITYAHYGRFIVPVKPILYGLVGVGAWGLFVWTSSQVRRLRKALDLT